MSNPPTADYNRLLRNTLPPDVVRQVEYGLSQTKKRGLPSTLTLEQFARTLAFFKWHCAYCLRHPFEVIDYIIPIEHGGGTTMENCLPCCETCFNKHYMMLVRRYRVAGLLRRLAGKSEVR